MLKVHWDLEEAVVLLDLYIRNGKRLTIPNEEIEALSALYARRATRLGIDIDSKYRNASGIKLQLACMHYVVTDGQEGMKNASKLFYQTYDLYLHNHNEFMRILNEFDQKYNR